MAPVDRSLERAGLRQGLLRALVIVAVLLTLAAVATSFLAWGGSVPLLDITGDPAGTMPF